MFSNNRDAVVSEFRKFANVIFLDILSNPRPSDHADKIATYFARLQALQQQNLIAKSSKWGVEGVSAHQEVLYIRKVICLIILFQNHDSISGDKLQQLYNDLISSEHNNEFFQKFKNDTYSETSVLIKRLESEYQSFSKANASLAGLVNPTTEAASRSLKRM